MRHPPQPKPSRTSSHASNLSEIASIRSSKSSTDIRQLSEDVKDNTKNLRALCIDNSLVRGEITGHFLRRLGISPEVVWMRDDSLWKQEKGEAYLPATALEQIGSHPLSLALIELTPADGGWSAEGVEMVDSESACKESVGVTSWTMAYLTKVYGRARGVDPRMRRGGPAAVPLFLLSNEQEAKLEAAAKAVGFAGVIVKPLRRANIAACFSEVLDLCSIKRGLCTLPEKRVQDASSGLEALKEKRFMVVDDNIVNRKVASKILEKYGIIVTCMPSGSEALKALTGDHKFDLVFMDIQMPGMDGYETTRAIRDLEDKGQSSGPSCLKRTPVLAMTADVMKGSWDKCKESGMDGFVTKPIEEPRLLQVVHKHLSRCFDERSDEEDDMCGC